jgi:hypothetical protein
MWKGEFGRAKCISFSRKLHQEITKRNGVSRYYKYFPDPAEFKTVSDFNELRPFFWYRTNKINPDLVFDLCREADLKAITLHNAPDPDQPPLSISKFPADLSDIKVTTWFESGAHYRATLLEHNVFFAPRATEGIGLSFLEAMASGLCVVAPNFPTMSEYIAHGTNGMLYSFGQKSALDFTRAKEVGARGRETVERGFVDWHQVIPELIEFIVTPMSRLGTANPRRLRTASIPAILPKAATAKISIVTVCLNAAGDLERTIESVLGQDWPNVEYVILDGGSTDGSIGIIEKYADKLALWRSGPDKGVYYAMNDALDLCTGDWVLFMNAGDTFVNHQSISRLLRHAPQDAEVIYGHHLYAVNGLEEYTTASDFETTWSRLLQGEFGVDWGGVGLPCHQATAVRLPLLRKLRFNTELRFVADHELLIRAFKGGAKFFNSDELIAIYVEGGISAQNFALCKQEWAQLPRKHGTAKEIMRFEEATKGQDDAVRAQQIETLRRLLLQLELTVTDLRRSRGLRLISQVAPKLAGTIDDLQSLLEKMMTISKESLP